ncbi:aldo/keto reductase [Vibrio sp. 1262-1]|uniref:aldo/keto reductase n=1 Tax=Vibrio sp. 1262-1 TaxID=3074548 RepID=UPI0029640BC0|nr:aldo/keto reductase [Vibrio sp. 1262-1]MDW2402504.1 aldo/keto reductase [Vibrio sp. 1262-1]
MMSSNVVVCIQARTNSSRLPGKVLLPIGGYPLAVLAAKRAKQNSDFDVRVLTSKEQTDDHLCRQLQEYEVPFFRGDLDDVLSRYVSALTDYLDETIIVRLTADNIFPDSGFISEVVDYFVNQGVDYVCANGENSGLPYGVSMEVTSLGKLREADKNATSSGDREHVTPYIRRNSGEYYYRAINSEEFFGLRCTIDSFDDYIRMTSLFSDISDPIHISTTELNKKLKQRNPLVCKSVSKLALGCVQLGLNYGINNKEGKPTQSQAHEMLTEAVHSGVVYLDTARAYGDSENVIGNWLKSGWEGRAKVITKLSPLAEFEGNTDPQILEMAVKQSVYRSCLELGLKKLDVLMLHRAHHLIECEGKILETLLDLKADGVIEELGVSVQTPEELDLALDYSELKFIQMPFNILDYRWEATIKKLIKAKDNRELTVHVRSVFLQGLLLSDNERLWAKVADNSSTIRNWVESLRQQFHCNTIGELAVKYVKSQRWVDALVLGADNIEQLQENIKVISTDNLLDSEVEFIQNTRPTDISERLINPALW